MDVSVLNAVIGAVGTIIGGIFGGVVARSESWEKFIARRKFPRLAGTQWESQWFDLVEGQKIPRKETLTFLSEKNGRIYGRITMNDQQELLWNIDGDYDERFLRLFWTPSEKARN